MGINNHYVPQTKGHKKGFKLEIFTSILGINTLRKSRLKCYYFRRGGSLKDIPFFVAINKSFLSGKLQFISDIAH